MTDGPDRDVGHDSLRKNLAPAISFLDNVSRRHKIVRRMANKIVRHQHLFLEIGEAGMKHLKISDVFDSLNQHESTVSRACAHKYAMMPSGTYELKRLFSVRIPNRFGTERSTQTVKYGIARPIEQESMNSPLAIGRFRTVIGQWCRMIQMRRCEISI